VFAEHLCKILTRSNDDNFVESIEVLKKIEMVKCFVPKCLHFLFNTAQTGVL
jgi:hypothetical protein